MHLKNVGFTYESQILKFKIQLKERNRTDYTKNPRIMEEYVFLNALKL